MDLDLSYPTLVVVLLVGLMAGVSHQQNNAQPGSVNNDPQINANENGVSTTIKTTTIRTVPPSTRPMQKTTLGPNLKTTTRATLFWVKTTNPFSTKNYNDLFTKKRYAVTDLPGENEVGSAHRSYCSVGVLLSSIVLFLSVFLSR